jgi:hypothetical protein
MENKQLDQLLEALHQELQKTTTLDDKGRDLLRDLDADIRALLGHSGPVPEEMQEPVMNRLQESLEHFEMTHPALTALLSDLMTSLSNVGI